MNKTSAWSENHFVVGVGASAGGLEALQVFFDHFPSDTSLSFVVVQHLSPDFKSLMDELLSRHTDMKIHRVDDEVEMQPGCVYLIPPKKNLSLSSRRLVTSDMDPNVYLRMPIDHFFHSLAEEMGPHAIGVILSGTGSDGTRGAAAVKTNGGFVLAQAPETCKFDGMPRSLIRSGNADKVLAPDEMADVILNYTQHVEQSGAELQLEQDPQTYESILLQLQAVSGIDFTHYRSSTISRRIERRIKVYQMASLKGYQEFLSKDPGELKRLHSDLLIGVTKFFRNPEAIETLSKQAIPDILRQAGQEPVRVWVAGCSTGEEAYTLAILFRAHMSVHGLHNDLKIFATDVDHEAIKFASQGMYPENISLDVKLDYLDQYFVRRENGYEVAPSIRNCIIFSTHNVVKDPPFTRLDLISCRNLLIYFKPHLQTKVLSIFHFGLKVNGYLFLGKSEALGDLAQELRTVDPVAKIFQKIRETRVRELPDLRVSSPYHNSVRHEPSFRPDVQRSSFQKESRLFKVYEKVLSMFVPTSLLVDENLDLLHVFGDAARFLSVPTGKSTVNVQRMLNRELALALTTAVSRVSKTHQDVHFKEIKIVQGGGEALYELKVREINLNPPHHSRNFLAMIQQTTESVLSEGKSLVEESYDAQVYSHEQIMNLEEQLSSTRESLQATIEELETTNEELQSANEELMSSNEELQSANEELQSVNEELYTVNAEYQSKIDELLQANRDIEFLLKSSSIGMIFLDRDLKIRRYNNEITTLINIMPHDIGRPLSDITFVTAHDAIMRALRETLFTGRLHTLEVKNENVHYLLRILFVSEDSGHAVRGSHDFGFVITAFDIRSLPLSIDRVASVPSDKRGDDKDHLGLLAERFQSLEEKIVMMLQKLTHMPQEHRLQLVPLVDMMQHHLIDIKALLLSAEHHLA